MVVNEFVEAWAFEIIRAVGRFFSHPAVYIFVISSIFVGYLRILRERKDFSFKVYDLWFELRTSLFAGIGYGLFASIITIGLGLVVSEASIWMILIWTLIFGLTAWYRYLSATYTFGATIAVVLLSTNIPISLLKIGSGEEDTIVSLAILLGIMLVIEGRLISKNAVRYSTPMLKKK